jgi:polyphosphate kinase 2
MTPDSIAGLYQVSSQYIEEIYFLQVEMLKLQKHVEEHKLRVAVLCEGRDTAGKGRAIFRFTQHLNPRHYRTIALVKPNEIERGQWYFQRYLKELPNPGEMVFFDRSWYNRAVVEPALGFCSPEHYELFMNQVNEVEKMLIEDGIILVKFWFSIKAFEQKERIEKRLSSPLQRWKVSLVDMVAQEKWEDFTKYKKAMFNRTHTEISPWVIVRSTERERSRIEAMKYVLSLIDYDGKSPDLELPKEDELFRYEPY